MSKTKAQKIQSWVAYHCLVLASALPYAWYSIPQELRESLPHDTLPYVAGVIGFVGVIGKVCQVIVDKTNANVVPFVDEKSLK